ncbi:MAG: ABC transporter substrate-binding protein [bacterium]
MKRSTVFLLIGAVCLLGIAPSLAAKYNEAPMLAEMVRAGKLPPVEERLPKEPLVVKPGILLRADEIDLEIGRYGGTERLVHHTPGSDASIFIQTNEPLLITPGLYTDYYNGNVLKGYNVSPDLKVYTFYMREGLKWSDGMPVTTEDVLFAYEDVLLNKELTPTFPVWLRSASKRGGEPMKLEVLDKYTFRISFAEPYGGFPAQLAIAVWKGYQDLLKPKHYLKQFHTRYTPLEKMIPEMQKEGLSKDEWASFFNLKDVLNWDITSKHALGFPVLTPWMMEETTATSIKFVRNPYYFKVDAAGNQLPYIDRLSSTLVQNAETAVMKIIAGEVDHSYEYGTLERLPLFKENAKRGGYKVNLYKMHRTTVDIFLNLTHPDPVWRQVVRDVRFRRALGHAINSEEIVDAVYSGFAQPPIQRPSKYDPDLANRLLDEVGLDKRDSEGFRLGPDGKRFVIPIEHHVPFTEFTATAELVREYWEAVGIKTTTKVIEPALQTARLNANELKATLSWQTYPYMWYYSAGRHPGAYSQPVGPLWNQWLLTNGEQGERPSAEWIKFHDLIAKAMEVSDEERPRVLEEWGKLIYDNVFWITTVDNAMYAVAINEKMGNVAKEGTFGIAAQFAGEVYFFRQ